MKAVPGILPTLLEMIYFFSTPTIDVEPKQHCNHQSFRWLQCCQLVEKVASPDLLVQESAQPLVFGFDMVHQNGNMAVQRAQVRDAGAGSRNLVGNFTQLRLISRVKLFMCGNARIIALSLELLLMGEMLVHIVQQKFNGRIQSGAPLPLSLIHI